MPPYFTLVLRSLASLEGWDMQINLALPYPLYIFSFDAFRCCLHMLFYFIAFSGLAVAGDPQFKTFQAAYPYVVQKLLYDNSAPTRTILNSVIVLSSLC